MFWLVYLVSEMLHQSLFIDKISIAITTAKLSANIVRRRARVLAQSLLVSAPRMPNRLMVIKATLLLESSVAFCASVFHDGERSSE